MERQPRFDLTAATEAWLDALRQRGTLSDDDLRELQTHLFDSLEPLKATGLSEEEAFFVARHRLGSAEAIGQEFGKIQRPFVVQREPVTFLLGALAFVVLKNGLDAVGYGFTAWLTRRFSDDSLVNNLDFGFRLLLFFVLIAGLVGYFRRGDRWHRQVFDWLHHSPVGMVLVTALVVGVVQFAWFFNEQEVAKVVRAPSRDLHGVWLNHRLYAFGFYTAWLVAFMAVAVRHGSLGHRSLGEWVKQAHALPLLLLGWCLFLGFFLGIGLDMVERIGRVPHSVIAPVSLLTYCLMAGYVLARNQRYPLAVRFALTVAPVLIFCGIGFVENPSDTLSFLLKNGSAAAIGAAMGLGLGTLRRRRRTIA